jgi:hypothetical protein
LAPLLIVWRDAIPPDLIDEEITKPMAVRLGVKFTPRLHIIQEFK